MHLLLSPHLHGGTTVITRGTDQKHCLLPPQSWSRGRVRGCMTYLMVRSFCRDNIVEMVATATRRNCLPTPSLGRCSRSKTCIVSTSNLASSPDPASTLDNLAWYPGCVGGEKCFSLPRWPGTRLAFNPILSNLPLCEHGGHFLPANNQYNFCP